MIAKEFLRATDGITNPQFSFCLFIAGRVLLAHSAHYTQLFSDEVSNAVLLLRAISTRWSGEHYTGTPDTSGNLASRFADRLASAHASLQEGRHDASSNPVLDIREPAYAEQQTEGMATRSGAGSSSATPSGQQQGGSSSRGAAGGIVADGRFQQADVGESPDSISLAFPPLPLAFQAGEMMGGAGGAFDPMGGAMANPQAFASPTGQSSYNAAFEDFRSIFDDSFQQDLRARAVGE
ncbi:hypothetical protein BFW01_g5833 [Lasiodiplodia theobromae]|nr:hypothetical protein BFW01_g5833 [Lasiodiplodia theobromae]